MTQFPMIVASFDSGISQALLDKMYVQLIVDNVHAIGQELTRLGTTLALLGNSVEGDDELSAHALAKALRELDSAEDQLRERRRELYDRMNALQSARASVASHTDTTILDLEHAA